MCGRFYIDKELPIKELKEIIAEVDRKLKSNPDYEQLNMPLGEIYPTNIAPALVTNKLNETMVFPMQWGFTRFDGKGQIINARSETALVKSMFKKPILEHRCLIPASNYFEWQTVGSKKVKHALRDPISQIIYMAGIYRYEADKPVPVFVILTRNAAPNIRYIHDRMPVILPKDAGEVWISDSADITDILAMASDDISAYAV